MHSNVRKTLLVILTSCSFQSAYAADECTTELRRLNDLETRLGLYTCSNLPQQIQLERDYAALFRRCSPDFAGEQEAHKHDLNAAQAEMAYRVNRCR
jgi:hypothetical protein